MIWRSPNDNLRKPPDSHIPVWPAPPTEQGPVAAQRTDPPPPGLCILLPPMPPSEPAYSLRSKVYQSPPYNGQSLNAVRETKLSNFPEAPLAEIASSAGSGNNGEARRMVIS